MIKKFLFTAIAIAGLCSAASASVVDWDYGRDKHHDGKFDDGHYYGGDGRDDHREHHNFSWDDRRYDHDKGDHHHHDHDFRWWLVASSVGIGSHDHWSFDDHGRYCRPGDPGDPGGGVSAVPLPSALSMFGGTFLMLGFLAWRRRTLQHVTL